MSAGRWVFPLVSLLAAACGPKQAPTVTPQPAASSSATGPVVLTPSEPIDDPRVVRCGVDDRPKSVVGLRRDARVSPEERAFLGDRMAPETFAKPMPPPPPTQFRPPPESDPPPPGPPSVTTSIDRGAPRRADGGPLASALADALQRTPIGLEACEDLIQDADDGEHALVVEIASSGAPLSVREGATTLTPSRLVRCAMERACQLKSPPGESVRVIVPLRVHIVRAAIAIAPPSPPPAAAPVPVDVVLSGTRGPATDDRSVRLRAAVRRVAGACGAGRSVSAGAKLRVTVVFQAGAPGSAPQEIRSQKLTGTLGDDLVSCVVSGVGGIPQARALGPAASREMIDVTFFP